MCYCLCSGQLNVAYVHHVGSVDRIRSVCMSSHSSGFVSVNPHEVTRCHSFVAYCHK
nr:MAG TPA: hypothetical protein [Caudoviricetes sp.]